MPKPPPIYDLVLVLDTSADDERRAKILADVEQAIADGGGSVELKQAWGTQRLAYEIDHKPDADYHLLQFGGPPALVDSLTYNLKITDGVLRHRIIRVLPGTPPPPQPGAPPAAREAEPEGEEQPVEAPASA